MPELSYQAHVEPEALPGRAYPHLPGQVPEAAFGGEIGRSIEGAASVVQSVQRQAEQTQLTDAHNQLQALSLSTTHDPKNGFFTLQGKDAIGAGPQYLDKFDEQAKDIVSNVPSPRARQAAQLAAAQVRGHLSEQIDTHTLQQTKEYGTKTAMSSIALAQEAGAANYNHPDIIATNLDHLEASHADLMKQQGIPLDDPQAQQSLRVERMKFHEGILTSMIADKKPEMARAYLDHVKGELKPQELKVATKAIEAGEVDAAVQPIMAAYSQDTTLGAKRVMDLSKSGLSQDQQFKVVQEVDQQRKQLEQQRRQDPQNQRALMALENSITTGKPINGAAGMINSLWRKGAISDDQRISLSGHIARVDDSAANDAANAAVYQDAYNKGGMFPTNDGAARKGMDLVFKNMTANSPLGSAEWSNRAIDIGTRTNVFPPSASRWASAVLEGGNAKSAAAAADMVDRMREANPAVMVFGSGDAKSHAMATVINAGVRAGADPEGYVEMVRENANRTDTKVLDDQWRKITAVHGGLTGGLVKRLGEDSSFKGHFWQALPEVPPAMQGDYASLTQQYFHYTGGNLSQAQDSAAATLKHVWGVSEVNGKRQFMAYAPEHMFPGLTSDAIHEDIANTVKGIEGVDARKVKLAPDPQRTARSQGSQWNLMTPDEHGMPDIVRKPNGLPYVYQLPVTHQANAEQSARAAAEGMEKARREQTLRREASSDFSDATGPT